VGSPRYKIGDLVRVSFSYFDFYTYPYFEDDDDLFRPWLGVVVLVTYDSLLGDEALYEIVCTDGYVRWYSEFELRLVNKS